MVLLEYIPPDGTRDEPYHDQERHHKYYAGEHDVPTDAVEEYLEHPGWERAAQADAEADADTDADADGDEGGAFDVDQFIGNEWRYIVDAIASGDVDDHLEAIRATEKRRTEGDGPRGSVLDAVEARLEELTATPDTDESDDTDTFDAVGDGDGG